MWILTKKKMKRKRRKVLMGTTKARVMVKVLVMLMGQRVVVWGVV